MDSSEDKRLDTDETSASDAEYIIAEASKKMRDEDLIAKGYIKQVAIFKQADPFKPYIYRSDRTKSPEEVMAAAKADNIQTKINEFLARKDIRAATLPQYITPPKGGLIVVIHYLLKVNE